MYCLDCGTKIEDNEAFCPNCGLAVKEMTDRIARAQEMIAYADTVGPESTQKLPAVSKRTYLDKEGNPFNPKDEVDLDSLKVKTPDKSKIPVIGSDDPFITMPMHKIVSDKGEVVADVDTDAKVYLQNNSEKRKLPSVKTVVIALVCTIVVVIAGLGTYQVMTQNQGGVVETAQNEVIAEDENTPSVEEVQAQREDELFTTLEHSYTNLGSYRGSADSSVQNFEGYFGVVNQDTRTQYSQECSELIDEVTQDRDRLTQAYNNAGVSEESTLGQSYTKLLELYGYILDRLQVIQECWDVSLSYSDPREYHEEILAPLMQDLEGGSSISMGAFDSLYPSAKPTRS